MENAKKLKNQPTQHTNMKILTPKQKALDIIHKICRVNMECSNQLAIVLVNEIIKESDNTNYWEHVKSEIITINQ